MSSGSYQSEQVEGMSSIQGLCEGKSLFAFRNILEFMRKEMHVRRVLLMTGLRGTVLVSGMSTRLCAI